DQVALEQEAQDGPAGHAADGFDLGAADGLPVGHHRQRLEGRGREPLDLHLLAQGGHVAVEVRAGHEPPASGDLELSLAWRAREGAIESSSSAACTAACSAPSAAARRAGVSGWPEAKSSASTRKASGRGGPAGGGSASAAAGGRRSS